MLALGCDHGGFELLAEIKKHLDELSVEYTDFGTYSAESVDYPVYAAKVAKAVASGECELGILVCGTGIGMSLAANKVDGIRAALCSDCFSTEMTRRHNNANIMCLGARVLGPGLALKLVDTFINTPFDGGRHARRVDMISKIEAEGADAL